MIKHLHIENFKSIHSLNLDCGKINIFIGEPNAGKTNIIEALSLTSPFQAKNISGIIRHKNLTDLFFDNNVSNKILIRYDSTELLIYFQDHETPDFVFNYSSKNNPDIPLTITHSESGIFSAGNYQDNQQTHFYKFKSDIELNDKYPGYLHAPHGNNLAQIIISNPGFRRLATELFNSKGLMINVNPIERDITISKIVDGSIFSYPYSNISETLKRIIFFMACLETNQNKTLLFDEPEANTFPFYTKYLAERIALDETNQYFFTTHNPYLLRSVVEKADKKDLRVIITYMEEYETKIRVLNSDELSEILDTDIFFNLDLFLKDAANS